MKAKPGSLRDSQPTTFGAAFRILAKKSREMATACADALCRRGKVAGAALEMLETAKTEADLLAASERLDGSDKLLLCVALSTEDVNRGVFMDALAERVVARLGLTQEQAIALACEIEDEVDPPKPAPVTPEVSDEDIERYIAKKKAIDAAAAEKAAAAERAKTPAEKPAKGKEPGK